MDKTNNADIAYPETSVTIRGYYRGFSVLVTLRNPETIIAPLVKKAKEVVDGMEGLHFTSSWKDEPQPSQAPLDDGYVVQPSPPDDDTDYGNCSFCGAKKVKNPKTDKIFCSAKCWLKNKK